MSNRLFVAFLRFDFEPMKPANRILIPIVLFLFAMLSSCSKKNSPSPRTGDWRGIIQTQGQEIPFNFEIDSTMNGYLVSIRNAEEKIALDEIRIDEDTITMVMHIFDAELRARIHGDSMTGWFIKNYESGYRLPFAAKAGQSYRFVPSSSDTTSFAGTYATTFTNETDTTQAVAIFRQNGSTVHGTFLTPTGDYRFIEGQVVDGKLNLSVLDGNHLYLFTAEKKSADVLQGTWWSGRSWKQDWIAHKDPAAQLPEATTLTSMKPGQEFFPFAFPDQNRKVIRSTDSTFKNKVVVVQLLGTWCPNCMDETRFLTDWYRKHRERGVEVVGLAFESKDEFTYAAGRVHKMKEKMQVAYPVLIAGNKDKKKAAEALPMLNQVVAFPTTIFIGKDGKVRKIHTGFSGPGTLEYYDRFIQEFNHTVDELLREPGLQ